MGQGQSGQAGFPGQGPPGEKKDQVSPSGSAFLLAEYAQYRQTYVGSDVFTHRSKEAQGRSLGHTAILMSVCTCCRARRRKSGSLHRHRLELERNKEEQDRYAVALCSYAISVHDA